MSGPSVEQPEPRLVAPDAAEALDSPRAGTTTVRGSALRALGYGVTVLLGLASAPLLVRHLGIVGFGHYMTVISLVALAGGVTDAGLTSIAVREWTTREPAEAQRLMRDLLGLRLVLTAVGILAAVLFALVAGYGAQLVLGTVLAGLGLAVLVLQTAYSVPLQTGLRLGWLALADVVRQSIAVSGIVGLVLLSANLVAFLALQIPAALGALVLTVALVRRSFPLRPTFHIRAWRSLVRETLPVAGAVALHHLYLRLVIVVMSVVAVDVQTGYFATAFRVTEVLIAVPFLLAQSTLPVLSRAAHTDELRLRYAVHRLFEASAILGLAVLLGILAGAPIIVRFLTGGEAGEIVTVLRLQGVAVMLVFLTVTWQNTLFAVRRQGSLVASNAIAILVTLALTLALVPVLEAVGAAVAAVLGELVLMVASAIFLLRARPGLSLSLGFMPRVLLAAALAALVFLIPDLPALARVGIVTAAYAGGLVLLGAVPPGLREAIAVSGSRRLRPAWRR